MLALMEFTIEGIPYPCELAEGHLRDISEYGDWRAHCAAQDAER